MAATSSTSLIVPTTPKQRDRMARILSAAREAFAENSFHKVLMDGVARKAGVGKGTIYRYFPDKESLYFAVIFDGVEGLQRQIRSTLTARGDLEVKIRGLVDTLVSFFRQNGFFFRLMNVEDSKVGGENQPNRQRWYRERSKLIDAIAEVLELGRQTGALHVLHPRTEAQLLLGMVRSVLRYSEEKLTVPQIADEIARIYLYGIHPR